MKKVSNLDLVWKVCLGVLAAGTFLLAGVELFDFHMSDGFKRILGFLSIASLCGFVFTNTKKLRNTAEVK